MKKLILVTALLGAIFTHDASAQRKFDEMSERKFRFGVKAGLNVDKVKGKAFSEQFGYSYQLGGFMQLNFSRRFGIQPELIFTQSSAEFTNDNTDIYDDLFLGGQQVKAKLNYLRIPLLLNVNVGPSKRVKLQVGPQWSGLLKTNIDSLKGGQNIFRNGEWAAVGGLWLQFPFFHLGGRYEIGLTNINDIDSRQKWTRQTFVAFVGLTF
jgi:Outer membrane protein beta-barrel domain